MDWYRRFVFIIPIIFPITLLFLTKNCCSRFPLRSLLNRFWSPQMEPQEEPEVHIVNEFSDYINISTELIKKGLLGPGISFGIIIGCSGHSPVPSHAFPRVVHAVKKCFLDHEVRSVWYGGDPVLRSTIRGGNIADILKKLTEDGSISAGAVQRNDWLSRIPSFVKIIISYDTKLASILGKKTFGGYEKNPPEHWDHFMEKLRRTCITPEMIPTRYGIYPMAATAGYLLALPCMASVVVLVVIPQAGFITFKEVEYVKLLLQNQPTAPLYVYAFFWEDIGNNLNDTEKTEKCKLKEIQQLLGLMTKMFPERVFLVNI